MAPRKCDRGVEFERTGNWLVYYVAAGMSLLQIVCVLTLRCERSADGIVTVPGDRQLNSAMDLVAASSASSTGRRDS
jgi:hypothetical protein